MMNDKNDRLMMSDELRGMVPSLEEDAASFEENLIVIALECYKDKNLEIISGTLRGISVEKEIIRVDIKTDVSYAYSCMKMLSLDSYICAAYHLNYMNDIIQQSGPFQVCNVKILDLDAQSKICTLGIDLVKS